jgi:basic amino acid/polyamine antiporter, APA family
MKPTVNTNSGSPRRQLNLLDSICIIVGIVIGAGIYETTPIIAQNSPGPTVFMLLWLAGGVIALIGAMCYAELAITYPQDGGDYVYLTRAYGGRTGFVFAWTLFWIVSPANIGALSFIFARYAQQVVPLPGNGLLLYAVAAVIVLTAINLSGVKSGKITQNILTLAKVIGLLCVCAIGLLYTREALQVDEQIIPETELDLALAMILIFFTYGGWRNIAMVAAEVKEPQKNLLLTLTWGVIVIVIIYLLTNFAFVHALGFAGVAMSQSVAGDVIKPLFGSTGVVFISGLICITCLGNINGMIFTTARIYYVLGREHRLYAWLGQWHAQLDSPVRAMMLQAMMTLVLMIWLGHDQNAFTRLVVFSSPVYWLFACLVAASLFVLRMKDRETPRSFLVPWYPWLPALFCLATLFMCYASFTYAISQKHVDAYWIIAIVVLGVLASLYKPNSKAKKPSK